MVYQILNANCDFSLISFKRAWDRRKSRQTIRQTDRQTNRRQVNAIVYIVQLKRSTVAQEKCW